MLQSIDIDNFKSLVDFKLDLDPSLTALIGLNGAGKTTFLQALDFLKQLIEGRVTDWLESRNWNSQEMKCHAENPPIKSAHLTFGLQFSFENLGNITWKGTYSYKATRCIQERFESDQQGPLVTVAKDFVHIVHGVEEKKFSASDFKYEGSILSLIKPQHELLAALKDYMINLRSLELLSPHLMKQRSRTSGDIGIGGEKLSGFISRLSERQQKELLDGLKIFYPDVKGLTAKSIRAGWRELIVQERHTKTRAKHLNDGMLRVLALIGQIQTNQSCILLEELENGINPEMTERLVNYLLNAPKQVIFTTHSPLILNYMPDSRAKDSVILLYKNPQGITRAKRFFEIPRMAEKLTVMGPGDAFVDTDLEQLVAELNQAAPPGDL